MKGFGFVVLFLLPHWLLSQDFSFSPDSVLTAEMDVDGYGVHQIDILNETTDSLWLTWRMVENTLPEEWETSLCDNVLCYGVTPTSADMNPIVPDSSGWIRMTTFPNNVAGSGYLHFWIYKTGFPQNPVSIYFYLSAGLTGTIPIVSAEEIRVFPNPTSGPLSVSVSGNEPVYWTLFNTLGRRLGQGENEGPLTQLDLSTFEPGNYWLHLQRKNKLYLIPLQKF